MNNLLQRVLVSRVKIITCFLLCFCAFSANVAKAEISSPLDLTQLTADSDLIVRGHVVVIDKTIVGGIERKQGRVAIERIIKGQWAGGEINVLFSFPAINTMDSPEDILTVGDAALFFFKVQGQNAIPYDVRHLKFPVRGGYVPTAKDDASPLEKVRAELLWSATAESVYSSEDQSTLNIMDQAMERVKKNGRSVKIVNGRPQIGVGRPSPEALNVRAVEQLRFFPPDSGTILQLNQLLSKPNLEPEIKGVVLATLLSLNQKTALAPAVKYVEENASQIADINEMNLVVLDVASSIGQVSDPSVTDELIKLVSHPQVQLRWSALTALRNVIQTIQYPDPKSSKRGEASAITVDKPEVVIPETTLAEILPKLLPALIHALDDTDARVRFMTISLLTQATSQSGRGPGYSPYRDDYKRSDEEPYIAYWKDWWAKQPK